jgi:hypothetical protein
MKQILYILKRNDPVPPDFIRHQAREAQIEIILIQDATSIKLDGIAVFALADDLKGKVDYPLISYKEMIEKIFNADTVITW